MSRPEDRLVELLDDLFYSADLSSREHTAALGFVTALTDELAAKDRESRRYFAAWKNSSKFWAERLAAKDRALREIAYGPEWRHGHPTDIAKVALSPSPPEQETNDE